MTAPTFFSLVTTAGQAALVNAEAGGTLVPVAHMALGDGNGAATTPNIAQVALVHEVYRAAPNALAPDPNNANWLRVQMVVPADQGGFTVREVGLFLEDGTLFAVANFPETYKPLLTDGSAVGLTVNFVVQVANAATVTLEIDPANTFVTEDQLAAETAARIAGDAALRPLIYFMGANR